MEKKLLRYIWQHSRSDQLWMVVVILASMPTYFMSLELPKRLVNSPIQGDGFENPGDTQNFMSFDLPFSESVFGEPITLFSGFELERVGFLIALSVAFLLLVVANGQFKLYINTYKGRMGERILRRLRFELFDRVLRYPMARFRRTKPAEIASMIKDEVEPMGEFIGDAFSQPLFLGGQAAVALLFIFLQNVWLGLATMFVIAFQAWLIPILRRRLIVLNKQRQIKARMLAGRLGEIVEGIQDAHTNDTTNHERAEVSNILGRLFFIRFEIFQRKFSVKFINNFLIQFLSFCFYLAGGYLVIRGNLDLGQLLGVIVAYKDLPAPVRGLIDHDQKRLTVETRYGQIVEQFTGDVLQAPETQTVPDGPIAHIEQGFEVSRLGVTDETGSKLIESASATIGPNERVAVVGNFGGGATNFLEVLAGVQPATSGRAMLDGMPIEEQPEYFKGRRIAYIDGTTFFPQNSIMNTLLYVLKSRPMREKERSDSESHDYATFLAETRRASNSELDYEADWLDYERAGVANQHELLERIWKILSDIGLEEDIRNFGLRGILDTEKFPELPKKIVEARDRFRSKLAELGFTEFVEPFDPELYNSQASIGENLLFGTADDPQFGSDKLPQNEMFRRVLQAQGLEGELYEMGKEITETTLELFGDLDPDNPFFDQLTYMEADELPEYRAVLTRIADLPMQDIKETDRVMIMRLPFSYIEEKNRLGLLTDDLKDRILKARQAIRIELDTWEDNPVAFYEPESYNFNSSIQDNVLLGRVSASVAEGYERVSAAINDLLQEMELIDDIFRIGLEFNIGSGGKRLTDIQRQKLHLARALLKRPDIVIANQALNSLSAGDQRNLIELVLNYSKTDEDSNFGVIWSPMDASNAELFDRVIIFTDGTLVTDDTYETVSVNNQHFSELTA